MKPLKILTITAVALMTFSMSASAQTTNVLNTLLEQAGQNNPVIQAANAKVEKADAVIREAEGKKGFKAGAIAGATWGEKGLNIAMPAPIPGELSLGYKDTYTAAVGLVKTLYTGGSLKAGQKAAEFSKKAIEAQRDRTVESVENAVRTAYYNRIRAVEKKKVAEEALTLTGNHLDRAKKLFKAGVVAKGDILRTKVAIAEAEMNLIKADNAVNLATIALDRAVGTQVDRQMLEADTYRPVDPLFGMLAAGSVEMALKNRSELKVYEMLSKQALEIATAAKGQLLPQIIAGGGYYTNGDTFVPDERHEWRAGIMASWTIYDSGEIKAKTEQAKSQSKEFLYRLHDMENEIRMEVTRAEHNFVSARARYNVALRRVEEAREDYRIAVKRYESGVGTNLDMLDSRLALTDSKTDFIDAMYDIELAQSDLAYATGN